MKVGDIMREHIKIKDEHYTFKFRVSGIIIRNGKVLLVEMDHAGFYCLPGGHVELGETTEEAMIREMKEETTKDTYIKKYLGNIENFFINKHNVSIHEIAFYYLMDFKDDEIKDLIRLENDEGTLVNLNFKWFDLNELDSVNIKPIFLKEILTKDNLEFGHLVIK